MYEEAFRNWLLLILLFLALGVVVFVVIVLVPVAVLGGLSARTFVRSCSSRGFAQCTLVAGPIGALTFLILSTTDWWFAWKCCLSILAGTMATKLLPKKERQAVPGDSHSTLPTKPEPLAATPSAARAAPGLPWRLYDVLLAVPPVLIIIGAVITSLYSRHPLDLLLLFGVVCGEVGFVAWLSHFVWRRFLPSRLTVLGVNVLVHGLVTLLLCLSDEQFGAVAAGLSFLGPFIFLILSPTTPLEVAACLGMTLLVISSLIPYLFGHLWRPCTRGAVFTSTGVAGWLLCGLACVTLCIAAGGGNRQGQKLDAACARRTKRPGR